MKPLRLRSPMRGFTLIEALTVIFILSILAGLGSASFISIIASQRQRAAASALQAGLMLTRSEALKRNTTVTLRPKSANLALGWSINLPDDVVLQNQEALAGLTFVPADASFAFNYYGRLSTGVSPAATVRVTSPQEGTTCWSVKVEASGRSSVDLCPP